MKVEKRVPPFDRAHVQRVYGEHGEKFKSRLVRKVRTMNEGRLEGLGPQDQAVYVANHQTSIDCFVPHLAILSVGAPWPRSIATDKLNRWAYRTFMRWNFGFDLEDFGILWHPTKKTRENVLGYTESLAYSLSRGDSLLVFPQAKRCGRDVQVGEFEKGFYSALLEAQRVADVPIKIECVACDYDRIPEIGGPGKKSALLDCYSALRWHFVKGRGVARVNFGVPFDLLEAAGEGTRSQQAQRVTRRSENYVRELLREARD